VTGYGVPYVAENRPVGYGKIIARRKGKKTNAACKGKKPNKRLKKFQTLKKKKRDTATVFTD